MAFSLSVARALEELATMHVHALPLRHRHESTTVLRTLATRVHESFCRLGGHDYLLRVADNRIFLQCSTCSHETPGWLIDIVHRRPKPTTMSRRNGADSDVTRARVHGRRSPRVQDHNDRREISCA